MRLLWHTCGCERDSRAGVFQFIEPRRCMQVESEHAASPNPAAILTVLAAPGAFGWRGPSLQAEIRFPRSAARAARNEVPPAVFPFTMLPCVTTLQAISSSVFKFVRRSGWSLTTGVCNLNEAAIGIDLDGLGNFLEGRAGFRISVDEHGNGDMDSRGSVPRNFGLRHDATHRSSVSARTFPTMGMVPLS